MSTPSYSKAVVSIRCYAFNQAPFIKDCLEGMLMQKTNFPFEIIIHDDASTDGTARIIKEYEARYPDIIKGLYEETNQYSAGGMKAVYERMVDMAEGRYTAVCEGDDYWIDPGKLQRQVDFLEANPDFGLCYTQSMTKYESKGTRKDYPYGGPAESFKDLLIKNTIPTATALYRSDLEKQYIAEVRPFDQGWMMGDYPKWLWFSHRSRIRFMKGMSAVYRSRISSESHSPDIDKRVAFVYSTMDIALYMEKLFNYPKWSVVDVMTYWKKELFLYAVFHEYKRFFKKLLSSPRLYTSPWCLALMRYFLRTKRPADRV